MSIIIKLRKGSLDVHKAINLLTEFSLVPVKLSKKFPTESSLSFIVESPLDDIDHVLNFWRQNFFLILLNIPVERVFINCNLLMQIAHHSQSKLAISICQIFAR